VPALLGLAGFITGVLVTLITVAFPALSALERQDLAACLKSVDTATQNLRQKYGTQGTVPLDDPNVIAIRQCQDLVNLITNKLPDVGNQPAIQSLRAAVNSGLSALTTCAISSVTPSSPTPGLSFGFLVEANVPLAGTDASGSIRATIGQGSFSGSISPKSAGSTAWSGLIGIPEDVSQQASGKTMQLTVNAQSDVGPLVNGQCPGNADPKSPPGKCFIPCASSPFEVVWAAAPKLPDIKVFTAVPGTVTQSANTPIGLAWNVQNATGVSIDQGVGAVGLIGSAIELPPDQDTTYTLTATGPFPSLGCAAPHNSCTATAKVTVEKAPLVFLTAPGNNSTIPGTSVGVAGTVQNARPGDVVEIKVNGASRGTVSVSGGAFSTGVALDKTLSLGDLSLSNPDLSINSNGARSTTVTLGNSKPRDATRNEITATVVGVPTSLDAVVVFNTVLVDHFTVEWLSCPPLNKDEPLSFELGAGQSVSVGTVQCGVDLGKGFCATCSVRASARTSLGTASHDATWTFNVQPCAASPGPVFSHEAPAATPAATTAVEPPRNVGR